MNEYFFIAISILSANLPANLSSIGHTLRKQGRSQKKTGPLLALLDSDIEDAIQSPKKSHLFLKLSRPLFSIDKVAINIIKVNSKIVKPETFKEIIGNPIYGAH